MPDAKQRADPICEFEGLGSVKSASVSGFRNEPKEDDLVMWQEREATTFWQADRTAESWSRSRLVMLVSILERYGDSYLWISHALY